MEDDCAIDAVNGKQRKRVYVPLIQLHLGKLDKHEIVHYDDQQKIVVPTQATTMLAEVIRSINELCDS
jgi:nitrate reductase NapAB chaperone NapD